MATITNSEFWKDFFELYKSLPEVWKIKSEIYKNKNAKIKAYEVLLEKYKEIDVNASVETVKKKINSIRACYRRELKKVKKSQKSGAGVDDLYSPSLWYFKELEFLKDQEEQIDGISSMEAEEDEENMNRSEERELQPSRKRMKKGPQSERNEIFLRALQQFEKNAEKPDEASTLSATWETLYRKLETRQQIFASRTIMEVLYQGALGKLDERSCKAFDKEVFPSERLRSSTPYSRSTESSSAERRMSNLYTYTESPLTERRTSNLYCRPTESPLNERRTSTPFSSHTDSPLTETYFSETSQGTESSYQTNPVIFSKYAPEQMLVSQHPNQTNLASTEYAQKQFLPTSSNQQQFGAVNQERLRPLNQLQRTYISKYAPEAEQRVVSQHPIQTSTEYAQKQFLPTSSNQQQFRAVNEERLRPVNQQQRTYFSLQELLSDTDFS